MSGLDRLSRSVAELGTIVQWLEEKEVRLVAVELDLDTRQPGRTCDGQGPCFRGELGA